jgi:uncharacterized protein YneF (UPF0154 family)
MPISVAIFLKYMIVSASIRMVICFFSFFAYGFFIESEKSYSSLILKTPRIDFVRFLLLFVQK